MKTQSMIPKQQVNIPKGDFIGFGRFPMDFDKFPKIGRISVKIWFIETICLVSTTNFM